MAEATDTTFGPIQWVTPLVALDFREYAEVEVQVIGAPGTPYQLQRSFDGVNFSNFAMRDRSYVDYSTLSAAGFFTVEGGGFLKFSAGAGSTIFVRASQ